MARITFSIPDELEPLIESRVKEQGLPSVSSYIASLVEHDLIAAGVMPGTPEHDIRDAALEAAEIAGPERVLAALQAVKANAYSNANPAA